MGYFTFKDQSPPLRCSIKNYWSLLLEYKRFRSYGLLMSFFFYFSLKRRYVKNEFNIDKSIKDQINK